MSFPNLNTEINRITNFGDNATDINNVISKLQTNVSNIDKMKQTIDKYNSQLMNQIDVEPNFDIDVITQFIEKGKIDLPTLSENITKLPSMMNDLVDKSQTASSSVSKIPTNIDNINNSLKSLVQNIIDTKSNIDSSLVNFQTIQSTILKINFDDFKIAQDKIVQLSRIRKSLYS